MLRAGAQGHHDGSWWGGTFADDQEQEDGGPQGRLFHTCVSTGNRDGRRYRVLQGRDGAISASRRVEAPSLHSNASSPGTMDVGGFFLDFEAVRTDLTEMLRAGDRRAAHALRARQEVQRLVITKVGRVRLRQLRARFGRRRVRRSFRFSR